MGMAQCNAAPLRAPDQTSFPASAMSSESGTPEELGDGTQEGKLQIQKVLVTSPQPDVGVHMASGDQEVKALTMPADEVLRSVVNALTSNPSSSSVTEDEASDTEGEALLDDSLESPAMLNENNTFEVQPPAKRSLSTVEEAEECETTVLTDDATPPSATSLASYGFDSATTASNAQSAGEGCIKSPGIFSLEELPEESKGLCDHAQSGLTEQQYIECGKQEVGSTEEVQGSEEAQGLNALQPSEKPEDVHPPYYSAICEKTDNSFAGLTSPPHHWPRPGDPHCVPPRLTCADLPPRKAGQQALSPQLRRLEQHQRQLMEMQQRREQQSRPLEGAEQERKRTEEEEQRKKKDEAEEELKRNEREAWGEPEEGNMVDQEGKTAVKMAVGDSKPVTEGKLVNGEAKMAAEEETKRCELELQLQQQQSELKQRQQILQWQQELEEQPSPGRTVVLSPSSGLCTIYEVLENSDDEPDGQDRLRRLARDSCERRVTADLKDPNKSPSNGDRSSPERPAPLDLGWGAKVDMVQQLINQTLLLNGDGRSSLLLLPGGAGGTLSPLESSLWPSLLPPISPPSATVTSVSSFSPEAAGSSPQGEWTVVELETHH
ncbi:GRB10-interacting GYF protein 2-like [Phycodurus eques]|uniref:GRB10-interacting GYF protein 2-like n=1 Tax=Phycodurus eques TaxID=693459 RepID=UPI002ACE2EE4|nr:GRB10-interacting GYF protein 2-like [Phycodurus eques]